jgi:DNA repair protein RadC
MERRGGAAASHEARLVRSARSLDRSRRLIASAQEREEKALSILLCHLAQTGQTHAVLGLFEILLEDDGLSVRRIAAASGAQLPLPQLEHPSAAPAAELRVADPAGAYTPALYEAPARYSAPATPRRLPRQVHFLAPEDARLLHFLEDMAQRARGLTSEQYRAPEGGALRITSPADVSALLSSRMVDLPQEQLRLLTLSVKNDLLGEHLVYQGTLNSAPVRPADVFRRGLADNAAAIIAVHNHPSGDPAPSGADMQLTRQLVEVGRAMEMPILDHVILARQGWVSLRDRGLM